LSASELDGLLQTLFISIPQLRRDGIVNMQESFIVQKFEPKYGKWNTREPR